MEAVAIDQTAREMLDSLKKFIRNKGWDAAGIPRCGGDVDDNTVIKAALNLLCWRTLRGREV